MFNKHTSNLLFSLVVHLNDGAQTNVPSRIKCFHKQEGRMAEGNIAMLIMIEKAATSKLSRPTKANLLQLHDLVGHLGSHTGTTPRVFPPL